MKTIEISFNLESAKGKKSEDRCTLIVGNAILQHFGKKLASVDECPITGADLMDLLRSRNLTFQFNNWVHIKTLADAVKLLPSDKVFYLSGKGHAMGLVEGQLIDTNPTRTPSRRSVGVLEVLMK